MWQTGDPVQMDAIALPQFDIRQEDIDYGNCTKYYAGTGGCRDLSECCRVFDFESSYYHMKATPFFVLVSPVRISVTLKF